MRHGAVLLCLLVVLAGCGSVTDGGPPSVSSRSTTPTEPTAVKTPTPVSTLSPDVVQAYAWECEAAYVKNLYGPSTADVSMSFDNYTVVRRSEEWVNVSFDTSLRLDYETPDERRYLAFVVSYNVSEALTRRTQLTSGDIAPKPWFCGTRSVSWPN